MLWFFFFEGDRVEEATTKELQDHPGTQARGHAAARRGDIILEPPLVVAISLRGLFSVGGSCNSQKLDGRETPFFFYADWGALFERVVFASPFDRTNLLVSRRKRGEGRDDCLEETVKTFRPIRVPTQGQQRLGLTVLLAGGAVSYCPIEVLCWSWLFFELLDRAEYFRW